MEDSSPKRSHHFRKSLLSPNKVNISESKIESIRSKFKNNYFGLPPYAFQLTPGALSYQSRKAVNDDLDEGGDLIHDFEDFNERDDPSSRKTVATTTSEKEDANFVAQRKVGSALLTMVSNQMMVKHFLFSGGFDAVLKLIGESQDEEVLVYCGQCLIKISSIEEYGKVLLDRGIFGAINTLIESPEDDSKHVGAMILAKLSYIPDLEGLMMLNGVLTSIYSLLSKAHRLDTIFVLLFTLCNLSLTLTGNDAEFVVRMVYQQTKKIDIGKSLLRAAFIADLYSNFSRISQLSSLFVDEGLLPFLMHVMDMHPHEIVLSRVAETIANFSINRKNRREIAGCGIGGRLTLLFENGSSTTRAYALLIMGNLLSSGFFHDKVAVHGTITNILENLLDKDHPKQFNAVSYCLCQLSKTESSSKVMVECSVIPTVLVFLRQCPSESVDYLWIVLKNIAERDQFFPQLVNDPSLLLKELFEEIRSESSPPQQQIAVVTIAFNISKNAKFKECLSSQQIELFVRLLKTLFKSSRTSAAVQLAVLISLINFAKHCPESRELILSTDLIELFYTVGIEDNRMNVRYAALLNIISVEEKCCFKLLDMGVQKLLVSLQDSFQNLIDGGRRKAKKAIRKSTYLKDFNDMMSGKSGELESNLALGVAGISEYDPLVDGELGKEHTAAIIHNIALKRPVLSPGVLPMILALTKNCLTARVLSCVRALAHMSEHSKSKLALGKEGRRIIPLLTVVMRCGCEDAEKVQYYCAIVLCNLLGMSLEKTLLTELIKNGAIVDLIVVTLLRINSTNTKDTLAKALFNLLGRNDIRESLILQLDIVSAVIELSKVESVDLLELSMRALYNITCELKPGTGSDATFAANLSSHKVMTMMINRLVFTPSMQGAMSNRAIRLLLGMSIANMSFSRQLVIELVQPGLRVADALYRVFMLGSDECSYCAIATLYNMSKIPECKVLADSKALQLIVEVLASENCSAICTRLGVSTICNFSAMPVFHDQLTALAIPTIVNVLSAPQIHISIKVDAIQAVYNMVTMFSNSRAVFTDCGVIGGIWKLMKVSAGIRSGGDHESKNGADAPSKASASSSVKQGASVASSASELEGEDTDEEALFVIIGHLLKDLCADVSDINILRKLMNDGVMNIILKLCKVENIDIKIDMSFCMYFLTRGGDSMRVLKRDTVDILFWLTLHDTMNVHDLILKNVARAMRSFAIGSEESIVLLKQERFFNVLKELIKSKHEDVLWQTAGILFNAMQVESCRKKLLEKGLIGFIFELAASGFDHVKHVCSACLHMVPDSLPNIEDPMALELILCLLDAKGTKFSEASEKPSDTLQYPLESCVKGSKASHSWTNFLASWPPFACAVDSLFTPSLVFVAHGPSIGNVVIGINPPEAASVANSEKHRKMREIEYDELLKVEIEPLLIEKEKEKEKEREREKEREILRERERETHFSVPPVIERAPDHLLSSSNSNMRTDAFSLPKSRGKSFMDVVDKTIQMTKSSTSIVSEESQQKKKVVKKQVSPTSTLSRSTSALPHISLKQYQPPVPEDTLTAIRRSDSKAKSEDWMGASLSYQPVSAKEKSRKSMRP